MRGFGSFQFMNPGAYIASQLGPARTYKRWAPGWQGVRLDARRRAARELNKMGVRVRDGRSWRKRRVSAADVGATASVRWVF